MFAIALASLLAMVGPVADASASAATSAATAPQASEDLKITQRIKVEFVAWQNGSLDRSGYSTKANEQLTDDTVDAMSDHLKPLGAFRSTNSLFSYKDGGSTIYVYSVRCDKGNVRMKLGFDGLGKISAVSFEPES